MAAVLVAARFCEPSSELHIAEDWYRRTSLSDLIQLGDEEVNKDRLYRGLDHLLAYKTELEAHLSQRCGELLAIQNEVLLSAVTSRYFEGQADANPQARRGYSRDHRPDCKQVFKEAFASAGLPYFNPHSFRKTLALLGGELCQTPEQYKAWSQNLGHEHVLTTFT